MGIKTWDSSLSLPGLIVERKMLVGGVVQMSGRLSASQATCPDYGTPSTSCHSRRDRMLSEMPVSGSAVQLIDTTFRCGHASCRRQTLSEPLAPAFGRRYGRWVGRCNALVCAVIR